MSLEFLCLMYCLLSMSVIFHMFLIAIFSSSSRGGLLLGLTLRFSWFTSTSGSCRSDSCSLLIYTYAYLWSYLFFIDQQSYFFPDGTVFSFFPHNFLHLNEVILLWSQDRARSDDSDPSNESRCGKIIVFHRIASNKSACSSESSFTVHSNGSFLVLCKIDEFMNNVHGRYGSISEIELLMFDSIFYEIVWIVGFVVQSDDSCHS